MTKREGLELIITGVERYEAGKGITPLELWRVIEQTVLTVRADERTLRETPAQKGER